MVFVLLSVCLSSLSLSLDELILTPPFSNPWVEGLILNSVLAGVAILAPKKLLTPGGLLHAWALGILIWATLGWQGYSVILFYFLGGSTVTRIGMAEKEAAGIAEKRSGARGPENVWGSALTAAFCAVGIWLLTILAEDVGNRGGNQSRG